MKSNPSLMAALTLLASAALLGPSASPLLRERGDENGSRRSVVRTRRVIVHVTAPEPVSKRAKRRARGKRKGGA